MPFTHKIMLQINGGILSFIGEAKKGKLYSPNERQLYLGVVSHLVWRGTYPGKWWFPKQLPHNGLSHHSMYSSAFRPHQEFLRHLHSPFMGRGCEASRVPPVPWETSMRLLSANCSWYGYLQKRRPIPKPTSYTPPNGVFKCLCIPLYNVVIWRAWPNQSYI